MRYELPLALDDQFVILREIKAGGFGVVYAGWDENLNLPIALKEIHPELLQQESGLQSFLAEAQMIARLDHPGIARLFTLKRSKGRVFMILEFIDGGDLRQLQSFLKERGRRLSAEACLYIIREVSKALHYAHVRVDPSTGEPLHLVHRDIAPSNFMISRQGAIKLIDFGIARVAGVMRPETMGGVIKGRPQYMSPEQISAPETLDHRSDIYSLAVVFLDMLTGQSVYGKTTNEYQLLDRVKGRQFELPEYFAEHGIHEALREPIERALQLSPAERTATARDFIDQLEPFGKAIQYDAKRAQGEVRQAAEMAFPVTTLRSELDRYHALRDAAATLTIQLPREVAAPDVTQAIATGSPTPIAVHEPPIRKATNWTGWILGIIAVGFAAAFAWMLLNEQTTARDTKWTLTTADSTRLNEGRKQDSLFTALKAAEDARTQVAAPSTVEINTAEEVVDKTPINAGATQKKAVDESRVLPKLERGDQAATATNNEFTIRSSVAAVVSVGGTFAGRVYPGQPLAISATDSRVSLSFQVDAGTGCTQTKTIDGVYAGAGGIFDPDTALVMATIRFAGASRNGVTTQIRALSSNVQISGGCEKMDPGRDYRFLPGMYEITTTAPGMSPRVEKRYLSAGRVISFQAG